MGKKQGSVTYMHSTDQEDEASKVFISYCVSDGFGNDCYSMCNGFKLMMHVKSKMNQFEIVVKGLLLVSRV